MVCCVVRLVVWEKLVMIRMGVCMVGFWVLGCVGWCCLFCL